MLRGVFLQDTEAFMSKQDLKKKSLKMQKYAVINSSEYKNNV
jgi:hypothetical protein